MKVTLQKRRDKGRVPFACLPKYSMFAYVVRGQSHPNLYIKMRDDESLSKYSGPDAVQIDTMKGVFFSDKTVVTPVIELFATYEE